MSFLVQNNQNILENARISYKLMILVTIFMFKG